MKVYTIHEQPHPPADRLDRAVELIFVKEGFCFSAALLTPFWLLAHRMWLPFVGYLAGLLVMELLAWSAGLPPGLSSPIAIGVHLAVGLEADTIRRWWLDRRGWSEIGSITGRTTDECQRRFLDSWLPMQPMVAMAGAPPGPAGTKVPAAAAVPTSTAAAPSSPDFAGPPPPPAVKSGRRRGAFWRWKSG